VGKAVIGVVVALAIAVSASDLSIAGIAAWKIVLAAAGAVIFVAGRRPGANGAVANGSVKGRER
jgi:uncharacterized protein (DUF2345 family)